MPQSARPSSRTRVRGGQDQRLLRLGRDRRDPDGHPRDRRDRRVRPGYIQTRLPVQPQPKPRTVKLWIEKERANRREDIVSPQAKVSANYASPMTAKAQARAEGYDEIVLVDEDGHLAEAPTSNLFFVHDGALMTPPAKKVLHG